MLDFCSMRILRRSLKSLRNPQSELNYNRNLTNPEVFSNTVPTNDIGNPPMNGIGNPSMNGIGNLMTPSLTYVNDGVMR